MQACIKSGTVPGLANNQRKARPQAVRHLTQNATGTEKGPKKAVYKNQVPVYESDISRWQKNRQSLHSQKSEGLYKKSAHNFEVSRGGVVKIFHDFFWTSRGGCPIFFAIFLAEHRFTVTGSLLPHHDPYHASCATSRTKDSGKNKWHFLTSQ